jgi:type II secretory pathway pseudopilin PulG
MEVLVALAIAIVLAALVITGVSAYPPLQQHQAARELSMTYELLHDEAVLRNVTFRVAFHLDQSRWEVEVGRPETLIFDDPDERAEWEERLQDRMKLLTRREKAEEGTEDENGFQLAQDRFATKRELPRCTRFGGVYTPQYGEMQVPSEDPDEEEPLVVYSYVFPNGFSEHTLVQLVLRSDPEEGYTIEVEPVSGRVVLHPDLYTIDQLQQDLPEIPPELP